MNYRTVLVLVLLLTIFAASLGVGIGVYYLLSVFITPPVSQTRAVACASDTLTCPDGSVVPRVRPACTFAACTSTASTTPTTGTVVVKVTISPVCPVESYPPALNCAPRGYAAELKIASKDGQTIKNVQTDNDGKFETSLPSGAYTVSVVKTGLYPRCESKQLTVTAGISSTLLISCDSGIR